VFLEYSHPPLSQRICRIQQNEIPQEETK
jgi:hypothetical protein